MTRLPKDARPLLSVVTVVVPLLKLPLESCTVTEAPATPLPSPLVTLTTGAGLMLLPACTEPGCVCTASVVAAEDSVSRSASMYHGVKSTLPATRAEGLMVVPHQLLSASMVMSDDMVECTAMPYSPPISLLFSSTTVAATLLSWKKTATSSAPTALRFSIVFSVTLVFAVSASRPMPCVQPPVSPLIVFPVISRPLTVPAFVGLAP
jgi:hypothetical protein